MSHTTPTTETAGIIQAIIPTADNEAAAFRTSLKIFSQVNIMFVQCYVWIIFFCAIITVTAADEVLALLVDAVLFFHVVFLF